MIMWVNTAVSVFIIITGDSQFQIIWILIPVHSDSNLSPKCLIPIPFIGQNCHFYFGISPECCKAAEIHENLISQFGIGNSWALKFCEHDSGDWNEASLPNAI